MVTRRFILQKARHHSKSVNKLQALTACKSTVSGSISLPSRGSFHLSLTVLCAIGSCRVFSLGRWSSLFPTRFLVSRRTQDQYPPNPFNFRYGAFTLSGCSFQSHSPIDGPLASGLAPAPVFSYNPCHATPQGLHTTGLGSSPFARRYSGNLG
jgi:hypothetical protein